MSLTELRANCGNISAMLVKPVKSLFRFLVPIRVLFSVDSQMPKISMQRLNC